MKLKRKFSCFLIVVGLITGCELSKMNPTQPVTIIGPSKTLAVATNSTTTSLNTQTLPAQTIQTTPTITIEQHCLTLEGQLPSNLQLTGVWLRQPGNPYLENFEEHTKYRVPLYGGGRFGNYEGNWALSPNGQWLAYLDVDLDTSERITRSNGASLRVIHSSGYSLSMDYWPVNFQKINGWLDDQHLLLELNYFSEVNRHAVTLNPFSGEWDYVVEPDWFNKILIERRWNDPVIYSPNLNEVILQLKDHSELRDFKTGALLFGNPNIGFFGKSSWSTDNVMLAITTSRELHIFQGKAEVFQFDLLEDHLATTTGGEVLIRRLSWSLDHRNLLLETFDESLVFDIEQRKVFVLCFTDKHIKYLWWSESFLYPGNGEFLVTRIVQEILPSYEQRPFEILIDMKNKRAYKLAESIYSQDRICWFESP